MDRKLIFTSLVLGCFGVGALAWSFRNGAAGLVVALVGLIGIWTGMSETVADNDIILKYLLRLLGWLLIGAALMVLAGYFISKWMLG